MNFIFWPLTYDEASRAGPKNIMNRVVFSTDDLSTELDDNGRFKLWRELHSDLYCAFDYSRLNGPVFSARYQFSQYGNVRASRFSSGAINALARTPRHIANDTTELFAFTFNHAREPVSIRCELTNRECVMAPGGATFYTADNAGICQSKAGLKSTTVAVARQNLIELVADPDDLILSQFDLNNPTLRHLARYLDIIQEPNDDGGNPLDAHIETTFLDLFALALGARRDVTEVARTRGLRAARLQDILLAIRKGFSDPDFSSEQVARALGVSRRYVNDLLFETDYSFAARVLELRLQKARMMLADRRNDRLKIDEVAFACGFNEVSYFHRCFRRRFGASPAQYRGSGGGDA
ncbi:AraC family transcriptional regulator [Bradyrhizobium sp. JYMT SZCCT0180]|uniref:AraC family transcriptional regulator n=1 Tax=Bradyrhizobium sp. JYMT SZCCT0180 TaxID=2807666 RepID=UPI001BA86138|nr:AraC family transcriptional regulator [Bradyrhizobium sp. JYMT SZCCT0180]MBR1209880.1 AraC family transcriptional regulator [Bradyrhizobium sp. JYMT SZCCT0180]